MLKEVYKDKQFLVFVMDDGKVCKYDFATKQAYGFSGKPVQDIKTQLAGVTIEELINKCTNPQYGKFLRFVRNSEWRVSNIGTALSRVPKYSNYEQIFSAGFEDIVDGYRFQWKIGDIPKSLIKIAKTHNVKITNKLVENWRKNPDAFLMPYELEFLSLDDNDILTILNAEVYTGEYGYYRYENFVNLMIDNYGYNAKSLFLWLDRLKTFEAFGITSRTMGEIYDYVKMMKQISNKFERYPTHFLTTHAIASRNYTRMKKEFSEELFKKRRDLELEYSYKDYQFIYPESTQDIKDEAAAQSNCVASYIDRVLDGACHILFLRKKDAPKKSLVTIEVRNNKIVQARRQFNNPVTEKDQEAIDAWNKHFSKKEKAA